MVAKRYGTLVGTPAAVCRRSMGAKKARKM